MNRREAVGALVSLPGITRISKMSDLKPDDVIVCECDGLIPFDAAERIRKTLELVWPGRKCVVLDDGLRLKVMPGSEVGSEVPK